MATTLRYALGIILWMSAAIAHSADDAFIKWASTHAIPVKTLDSGADFQDLLPMKSMIGTARVVALGENIHGAHEPMAFRNRLFRFLVEQMGFTAIALEGSSFGESRTADSFVGGGPGDAQGATRDGLACGFNRFENRELIQWMRNYNATATATGRRRIHFYGIDIGGECVSGPRRAIDYALAFLSRADPMTADKIRVSVGDSLPRSDDDRAGLLPAPTIAKFDSSIAAIDRAIEMNRNRLVARSSPEEYRWALHDLDVARQLANHLHLSTTSDFRDAGPSLSARDYAMAENVQWVLKSEGPQGRLLVFAHDGHVMNWKVAGGIFGTLREKPVVMGTYLRKVYGDDLFIMVTSSASASAGLPVPEPIKDSIDSALAQVGLPAMILDIREARQNKEAFASLSRPWPLHANLSSHFLIVPSADLDAFFFVRRLTPSQMTPR